MLEKEGNAEWFEEGVEFSPDGALVVTHSNKLVVETWNSESGVKAQEFSGHSSFIQGVAFSEDGRRIITCSNDRTARLWGVSSGREIQRFEHPGPVAEARLSRDGTRLLTKWGDDPNNSQRDHVWLWDVPSGKKIKNIGYDAYGLVGFSPDGKRILATEKGRPVALLDATDGEVVRVYK